MRKQTVFELEGMIVIIMRSNLFCEYNDNLR